MPPGPVVCSACKARFKAPNAERGKRFRCPKCKGVAIPAHEAEAPTMAAVAGRARAEDATVFDRRPSRRATADDAILGRTFGGVKIEALIGRGGMGVVYRARHLTLDKPVAIKILDRGFSTAKDQVLRFIQEARAAARVEHQNLVQIHDVNWEGEIYFIVMQLVEGQDLADRIGEVGPLPIGEAVDIFGQILAGMEEAHRNGIIHRDLKPANILLDRLGRVKVTDFGLAQDRDVDWSRAEGLIVGTPQYMSPEQCRGEPVDVRSDIYSLGMTFYHALTGQLPFDGKPSDVVRAQIEKRPRLLVKVRPDLPANLVSIIDRMIAKRPENRYPSVPAVRRDLDSIARRLQGISTSTVGERAERGRSSGARRRVAASPPPRAWLGMVWVSIGLVLIAALVAVVAMVGGRDDERPEAGTDGDEPRPGPGAASRGEAAGELGPAEARALLTRIQGEWLPAAAEGDAGLHGRQIVEATTRILDSPKAEAEHIDARVLRVQGQILLGRSDLALADAHRIAWQHPESGQRLLDQVRAIYRRDLERRLTMGSRQEDVLRFARSGAEHDPNDAWNHFAHGHAAARAAGQDRALLEEAEEALTRALSMGTYHSDRTVFLEVRGEVRARLGRSTEAADDLRDSLRLNESGGRVLETLELLGLVLAASDRLEEAFVYLSVCRHLGRAVRDRQWEQFARLQDALGATGPADHARIESIVRIGVVIDELVPRPGGPMGLAAGDLVLDVRDVRIYDLDQLRTELLDRSRDDHGGSVSCRVEREGTVERIEIYPARIERLAGRTRVDLP